MKLIRSTNAVASLAGVMVLSASNAYATDEIQVYNAGIAEIGQFTIQQHLNYVALDRRIRRSPAASRPTTASTARLNLPTA